MKEKTIVLIWDLVIAAVVLGVTYAITKYKLSDYVVWAIALWICYFIFVALYKEDKEKDGEDEFYN